MNHRKNLVAIALLLSITTLFAAANTGPNSILPRILPAHATTTSTCPTGGAASPCLTVSLDPISKPTKGPSTLTCDTGLSGTVYTYGQYGLCDILLSPAAANVTTFRVGAFLNATAAATLGNVFAWQFQINYDPTIVTPVGDPAMAADSGVAVCVGYPDCGIATVAYGTQINDVTAGNSGTDWAKAISIGPGASAGGSKAVSICENGLSGGVPNPACLGVHTGQILVGFTYVAPSVQITAINARTVLANVAFAIVSKAPAVITISNFSFRDSGSVDLGVQPAPLTATCAPATSCGQTTNTIGNNPPVASFTFAHTGTAYSFTDTSTDADPSDTFRYLIWDFGDGSSILNTTATTATHDYGMKGARSAPGLFNVTLRVVDNQGDTSAARDRNGLPIVNQAPQHTFSNLHLVELGSQPKFTFAPANPSSGTAVNFDASTSTYPDEPLLRGTAPVGGIALTSSNAGDATCLTISGLNCPVGFVDNNANGVFDPGVDTVVRANDGGAVFVAGDDIMAGPTITPSNQ